MLEISVASKWLFPAPQIEQTSRTAHTAKQTASFDIFMMSANIWRHNRNHINKQGGLRECICSYLSSPELCFWPNTFVQAHLPNLAAPDPPPSRLRHIAEGIECGFDTGGPWCSKDISSDLNSSFIFFLFDGTPSQPDWLYWIERRKPRSTYSHPHMFSFTLQTLLYPCYVSSLGCQSNIHK